MAHIGEDNMSDPKVYRQKSNNKGRLILGIILEGQFIVPSKYGSLIKVQGS
jgi:hypothetical protein